MKNPLENLYIPYHTSSDPYNCCLWSRIHKISDFTIPRELEWWSHSWSVWTRDAWGLGSRYKTTETCSLTLESRCLSHYEYWKVILMMRDRTWWVVPRKGVWARMCSLNTKAVESCLSVTFQKRKNNIAYVKDTFALYKKLSFIKE